jgi:hypothetical protein
MMLPNCTIAQEFWRLAKAFEDLARRSEYGLIDERMKLLDEAIVLAGRLYRADAVTKSGAVPTRSELRTSSA